MSSTTDSGVIEILENRAGDVGAVVLASKDSRLDVSLPVTRTGGEVVQFALRIECYQGFLTVRELQPNHLPVFCPERHINDGGSFCLYWKPADGIEVDDAETGTEWWSTVLAFLKLQLRAARLRRWPNRLGRAHGEAARYQYAAEGFARPLGLSDALLAGELRVTKGSRGSFGRALRLVKGNARVLAVWHEIPRVVTVRRPCVCGQHQPPRAMIDCDDHAAAAARLVVSMKAMQDVEAAFMKAFAHRPCCGTMDDCPLKKAA